MSGKHCANCGVGTLPTPSPGTPPTTGSGCPRTLTKPCGRWWTSGTPTSAPVAMPPCTPGGERNVDALNRIARDRFALDGRLTGPEVVAPGGRHYSVGDRIVSLAPAADGQVVTSERGEVVSVDVHRPSLIVRMDAGRFERLECEELAKDRLGHGYAITVHRAQASTVDAAHRYEDGGGRALGYVSMSRGRECNTVHVVADSLDQAVEDLSRDWAVDRRARWAIDSGTPATDPHAVEHHDRAPAGMRAALRHARLQAERQAVAAAIPPDPTPELGKVERQVAELRRDRTNLLTGHGRYGGTTEGDTARRYIEARERHRAAQRQAESSDGWRERRHWRREAADWASEESAAERAYVTIVRPELNRLDDATRQLDEWRGELQAAQQARNAWLAEHPEATRRILSLDRELTPLPELPEIRALGQHRVANLRRGTEIQPSGRDHGIDLDLGP